MSLQWVKVPKEKTLIRERGVQVNQLLNRRQGIFLQDEPCIRISGILKQPQVIKIQFAFEKINYSVQITATCRNNA